ncbi:PIG-L family deacetylase [Cytophagales bacterium LB-30]|uniref:PIG-L family deacetylase n=1 Tax=Shiella aurantiaca TaxID=3058365 RepID=A0ABT8F0V7_9BACT|nr:PIG-L family deacetylase [Shiella aurantiaca]MDN4164033.1 PIG-L family deacetylase [Shiella aurantiaca]
MRIFLFTLIGLLSLELFAQQPKQFNSSEILQALHKAKTFRTVLYVAAHPDDENTRLIAWLSKEQHTRTAYLSLTRGDGGQNLIGPEIREELGIIRTQELLAARRVDGGEQYFSTANDFGFSKSPEETFTIWDKEKVLSDMVRVIRQLQPDIIITRFNPEPSETHGHHTASAMLALEAIEAAADASRFPEQVSELGVWRVAKAYWNTSRFFFRTEEDFNQYTQDLLPINVGQFNPLLGESYGETAARSRSMHKSQGFGSSGSRGEAMEYLKALMPNQDNNALFAGLSDNAQHPMAKRYQAFIDKAIKGFNPQNPSAILPMLKEAYKTTQAWQPSVWKVQKQKEIERLMSQCLGLYAEVSAAQYQVAPGDSLQVQLELINRSVSSVRVLKAELNGQEWTKAKGQVLKAEKPLVEKMRIKIADNRSISQPYWLQNKGSLGMYAVLQPHLIGQAENRPALMAEVVVEIEGMSIPLEIPLVFKTTDPVKGEVYKPLVVVPPVATRVAEGMLIFPDNSPKEVEVLVKAGKDKVSGDVLLSVPEGWQFSPASYTYALSKQGEEKAFRFTLTPPAGESKGQLIAKASYQGKMYMQTIKEIDYEHIPVQTVFPEAVAELVKVNLQKRGQRIGYIMGAGDEVPASLQQMGYEVELLDMSRFTAYNLSEYDALVVGVRAYNTVDALAFYQKDLLAYVQQGGTMVVQYNTSFGLVTPELSPYALKISRDRVTVESAPVKFLAPKHPVLNYPNAISEADFEGWVQERGLYFPSSWDDSFTPILSSHDPSEPDREGGLLVAQYGKGFYVYTGYSFFRQLPAGVPGALKLFTNLVSLGKE